MGSPLTIDDFYDMLDNNQLNTLISKIMEEKAFFEKMMVKGDCYWRYGQEIYWHDHFIILKGQKLIFLQLGVYYWTEIGVGLTYEIRNVTKFDSAVDYQFYKNIHSYGNQFLEPKDVYRRN